jgi:hypothetical protein
VRPPLPTRELWRTARRFRWLLWVGTMALALYPLFRLVEARVTWYLSIDQLGYLTFARDLLGGHVFHDWPPATALTEFLPSPTDVLAQSYLHEGGRVYSRYAPGYPLLLAGWIGLFGVDAAHLFNPCLLPVFLLGVAAFLAGALGSPWRGGAGAILTAILPTQMVFWFMTVTRDPSAHLFGLVGLALLWSGRERGRHLRVAAAALLLGFAVAVRPDAILYLVPAGVLLVTAARRAPLRALRLLPLAATGLAVGVAPLVAINVVTTGNPFWTPQVVEIREIVPGEQAGETPPPAEEGVPPRVAYPPPSWRGGTHEQVQGGGISLGNLPVILPENLGRLAMAFGPFGLALMAWGLVVASVVRRRLVLATLPYVVLALLFFSCWPRSDARYLIGVYVFLTAFVVEGVVGTAELVRWLRQRGDAGRARTLGIVVAGVAALGVLLVPGGSGVMAVLGIALPLVAAGVAFGAALRPGRVASALAGPVLMLVVAAVAVADTETSPRRAPFQAMQMRLARQNFVRLLEPNAVVITSERVGRPAENLEFYGSRVHALYLTDLARWNVRIDQAAALLIGRGLRPYLFLPPDEPARGTLADELRFGEFQVERVADVPASKALLHFVAAPFHGGVAMQLDRISHPTLEAARAKQLAGGGQDAPASSPSK